MPSLKVCEKLETKFDQLLFRKLVNKSNSLQIISLQVWFGKDQKLIKPVAYRTILFHSQQKKEKRYSRTKNKPKTSMKIRLWVFRQKTVKTKKTAISRLWHNIFAKWYTSSKRPNSFIRRCKSTSKWCTFLTRVQLFDMKT